MHICIFVEIYTDTYIHCRYRQTCMHSYTYTHVHICMYVCMCVVVLENQSEIAYDKQAFRHSAAPTATMKFAELQINLS